MKLKKIYLNTILIIFHTLFLFFIIEVISTIIISNFFENKILSKKIIYSEKFKYSPHPYLSYYPTPKYSYEGTSHNSLGYRGPEIGIKNDDTYRIITVGGSTTYTESVKDNKLTFPQLMEDILSEDYNVEVINAGIGGHSSFESLINVALRVIDLNPDAVIIYHGTNDVHTRFVPPYVHLSDNTGRRKSWSNEDETISSILDYSSTYRLFSKWENNIKTSPNYFTGASTNFYFTDDPLNVLSKNSIIFIQRNFENIISILNKRKIKVLLATFASTKEYDHYAAWDSYQVGFQEQNEMIKNLSESNNISLLDFANLMPEDREYWADGVHVNEAGALKKAKIFSNFIINNFNLRKYKK